MPVSVAAGLASLGAITAGGTAVQKISVGDQVVWEPPVPNDQVPYTVPFMVVGADAPPPPPAMSLTSAGTDYLSVVASGTPEEDGFGEVTGYFFYLNGVKNNATADADGVYTYTGLTDGTAYTLTFTFVNGSGTESTQYASMTRSTVALSRAIPTEIKSTIDGYVPAFLKPTTEVDGCLLGIHTSGWDYQAAYGGDRTAGLVLTLDHKMRYGSVTKMYTALLVLKQVDVGHLSLDDKLSQYVSGPSFWDRITIRHLLMMQSGIEDYLQQDASVQQTYFLSPTAEFDPMPHILSYTTPLFEPGSQSSYSNSNYILLGKILEWCDAHYGSGRDIITIVQQDLLNPLGLTETEWPTGTYMTAPYSRGWADNLALPQIQAILGPFAGLAGLLGYPTTAEVEWTAVSTTYGGAAGALDGTISDLVDFGKALGSAPMLSPEMKQYRDENFVTYLTYTPAHVYEGPGWMGFGLGVIQWGDYLGWIGNLGGYHSVVFVNPNTGTVIAVLMNHMQADPLSLFYKIAYLLDPDATQLADQTIRPETIQATVSVREPAVYVRHDPGDEDGKTDVPLKVPFYV